MLEFLSGKDEIDENVACMGTILFQRPTRILKATIEMNCIEIGCIYRMFQKKLYNFESLYKFIQRICTSL
jgi:hypothetical protein